VIHNVDGGEKDRALSAPRCLDRPRNGPRNPSADSNSLLQACV
jgi:hypothetical protein